MPNPLTILLAVLTFLVLVFRAASLFQFMWLTVLLAAVFWGARLSASSVIRRLRSLFLFLPIMFVLYLLFSLLLTGNSVAGTVSSAALSALRILLMITAMSMFLGITSSTDLLDAARTVWRKTGLRWRVVEDMFQMFYLVSRFFPLFGEEILASRDLDKALGIPHAGKKAEEVKRTVSYLPALIANCMHRAENLGLSMNLRGYGKVVPRGQARPIGFSLKDVSAIILLVLATIGFFTFA